jgi:hypothetical protein
LASIGLVPFVHPSSCTCCCGGGKVGDGFGQGAAVSDSSAVDDA